LAEDVNIIIIVTFLLTQKHNRAQNKKVMVRLPARSFALILSRSLIVRAAFFFASESIRKSLK
jgi:hypothetical protein